MILSRAEENSIAFVKTEEAILSFAFHKQIHERTWKENVYQDLMLLFCVKYF